MLEGVPGIEDLPCSFCKSLLAFAACSSCTFMFADLWCFLEALQLLANLWNYTKVNIRGNIAECKKAKKRKTQRLGEGFDVTCQDGRIAMLGLKKPAPVKISELEKAICRLPKLRGLLLDGSSVTGSLEEVKGWTHLERLHMRSCKVGGDLKHLQDLKKLKFLKLSGRNIQGSLHDLDQDFEILNLGHTSVTGDLSKMSSKTSRKGFRGLWLQNTSVSGDIMDILKKNPRLQYLHLPSTKVSGALCNPEQKEGKKLKELDLSNSLVTICSSSWKELGKDVMVIEDCPFPHITKLDVTGCNLAMDVWDFLSPLAKTCYHLAELRAANCSLSGDLQGISRVHNYLHPMYWQISVLDLSHNNITRLLGQARACWLDVSNNSLKTIDPSYFKETLFLDLRNTPYNASKEVGLRFSKWVVVIVRSVFESAARMSFQTTSYALQVMKSSLKPYVSLFQINQTGFKRVDVDDFPSICVSVFCPDGARNMMCGRFLTGRTLRLIQHGDAEE